MNEIMSRCGYRCDLCQAHTDNVEQKDDRTELSRCWKKYFGLDLPKDQILCAGCYAPPGEPSMDGGCPVKPCVIGRGLEHCGQCDDYPCSVFEQRRGLTMEAAAAATGDAFSVKEYRRYILPYDNGTRLDALRLDENRNMRMTNKWLLPDVEAMARFIGVDGASAAFRKYAAFLSNHVDLSVEINYGGKNYGWQIAVRKGAKPIVSVTPVRKAFLVLCVMGKNELELAGLYHELLSVQAHQLIADTHQFHDGKWVTIRVADEAAYTDALGLFAIKRYGKKAREGLLADAGPTN